MTTNKVVFSKTLLGPQWAPLPGITASFLVSGLMQELIFYYVTRGKSCVSLSFMEVGVMKWLGH